MAKLYVYKVNVLPSNTTPDSLYFVGPNTVRTYITDMQGVPHTLFAHPLTYTNFGAYYVDTTFPTSPKVNDHLYNPTTNELFIYDGDVWLKIDWQHIIRNTDDYQQGVIQIVNNELRYYLTTSTSFKLLPVIKPVQIINTNYLYFVPPTVTVYLTTQNIPIFVNPNRCVFNVYCFRNNTTQQQYYLYPSTYSATTYTIVLYIGKRNTMTSSQYTLPYLYLFEAQYVQAHGTLMVSTYQNNYLMTVQVTSSYKDQMDDITFVRSATLLSVKPYCIGNYVNNYNLTTILTRIT